MKWLNNRLNREGKIYLHVKQNDVNLQPDIN